MKKWLCILSGMICCALCPLSVRADVIWEPEDSFYDEHASECHHVNRLFTANGPDGIVIVYKSPEIPEVVDTWENGRKVSILFTYEDGDGILWGVYDNYKGKCGWVPMDYMEVVYDSISFREEYASEILKQNGQIDDKYIGAEVFFWSYPGGDIYISQTLSDHTPEYHATFVDEDGNLWGNIGYYYGIRDRWICIARPDADYEELYPEGGPRRGDSAYAKQEQGSGSEDAEQGRGLEREIGPEEAVQERIVPKKDRKAMTAALAMVALAVSVSAVLLKIWSGKKERDGSEG